jgi:hypothetical protein
MSEAAREFASAGLSIWPLSVRHRLDSGDRRRDYRGRFDMRYLLTIIGKEADRDDDVTPEQIQAMMDPWNDYNRELLDAGVFVAGDALHPSSSATTVTGGQTGDQTVTDGPFAETKEQLGGFYLLECNDLDEALEWAKKVPARPQSAVEVWPVVDFSGSGYLDPYAEAASAR